MKMVGGNLYQKHIEMEGWLSSSGEKIWFLELLQERWLHIVQVWRDGCLELLHEYYLYSAGVGRWMFRIARVMAV